VRRGIGAERNQVKNASRLRLVGASIALAAVSVAGVAGPASATPPSKQGSPAVKTFTFKGDRKTMRLEGPAQIRQGATLKIKNKTDAREVGPHTFTLAKASEIPKTKKQQRKCANLRTPFCAAVAFEWHLFEPPNTINRPLSDVNEQGWDTMGDRETIGDSWFTGRTGEGFSAAVSADPGTLRYFCVVHPFLKGKLQVTAGPTS
jgi:hypothetical protein